MLDNFNVPAMLSGLVVDGMPISMLYPGKQIFVCNSTVVGQGSLAGADTNPGTLKKPLATVARAIELATAGRGDMIIMLPGHSETLSASLAMNKQGVALVGLGRGSNRGTLNIGDAGHTIAVSAADCALVHCLVTGGIDAVAAAITISAASCLIAACELRDVTGQMTVGILTTAAADYLRITDHRHNGAVAAGTEAAIKLVGGDRARIDIRNMDGNFANAGIEIITTAATNLLVHDVQRFRNRNSGDLFIKDTVTGSTGQIGPNINIRVADNAANITEVITGATLHVFDPVYVVNNAGEKAMLINWTASADA